MLYVRHLILEPGVTVDLNGGTVYHETITPEDPFDPGSGVTVTGAGNLIPLAPVTAVSERGLPRSEAERIHLQGAAPNPFRAQAAGTWVRFSTSEHGHVSLRIHDAAGRVVRRLLDRVVPAGDHRVEWNGRTDSGTLAAGGMYFCTVEGLGARAASRITFLP